MEGWRIWLLVVVCIVLILLSLYVGINATDKKLDNHLDQYKDTDWEFLFEDDHEEKEADQD